MTPKLPAKTYNLRPRKKRSLYLFTLACLAASAVLFYLIDHVGYSAGRYVLLLFAVVSAGLFLFGLLGIVRLRKEGFVGLFISGQGINDISTGHTYGMVQWKDVYKIKIADDMEHPGKRYIIVKVTNPEDYIDRETVSSKKRSMVLKQHYYGSPICFSNRAIQCSFDQLHTDVMAYYENFVTRREERLASENTNK